MSIFCKVKFLNRPSAGGKIEMGRNKDSLAEKKLRGTVRKDRLPKKAAVVSGGEVTDIKRCMKISGYADMTARGKAIYRAMCYEMMKSPGLYKSQLRLLIMYANTYETYIAADKMVQADGILVTYYDSNGNPGTKVNPAVLVRDDAKKQYRQMSKDFAIPPIDMQKLKIEEATDDNDPLAEFLEKFD